MIPQEKAKELVEKFKPHAYNGECDENDELMECHHAKQCAIICVDEIMLTLSFCGAETCDCEYSYWKKIKEEILNA